jgi:hypothetical protein
MTEVDIRQLRSVVGVKRVDDETGISSKQYTVSTAAGARAGKKPIGDARPAIVEKNVIIIKSTTFVSPAAWTAIIDVINKTEFKGTRPKISPPIRWAVQEAVCGADAPFIHALVTPWVIGGALVVSRIRDDTF